jgi:predicted RNA-binding Zn-ribbon protein involved in translation (DUF1610 family)
MELSLPGKTCLKCGHQRTPADPAPGYACPACGAVYAKLEAAARGEELAPSQRVKAAREHSEKFRTCMAHFVYFLLLLPFGIVLQPHRIARLYAEAGDDWLLVSHFERQAEIAIEYDNFFDSMVSLGSSAGLLLIVALLFVAPTLGLVGMAIGLGAGDWLVLFVGVVAHLCAMGPATVNWYRLFRGKPAE